MNTSSARSVSCLMLTAALIQMFSGRAFADVDCQLTAPPGVTKTAQGAAQAQIAANTLLRAIEGGANVSASGKTTFATAQQNAPGEDPDALKAKTLYIFCGMVANATDISTERKFEMLKELRQVPIPPASPSPPTTPAQPASTGDDIPSRFGLPALGTSRDKVAEFALTKHGVWRSSSAGDNPYVMFDGELDDHPATIKLWVRAAKMYAVTWEMSGWRQDDRTGHGQIKYTGNGQDPSDICGSSFIDGLTNFFIHKVAVAPEDVSDDHIDPIFSAWGTWGIPPIPDICYRPHSKCEANAQPKKHYVRLVNETQLVKITSISHKSTYSVFSDDPDLIELTHHEGCDLTITAIKKND
jgi:hypothetical protein